MLYEVITYSPAMYIPFTGTLTEVTVGGAALTVILAVSVAVLKADVPPLVDVSVITSYSIHYTKLYDSIICPLAHNSISHTFACVSDYIHRVNAMAGA